MSVLQTLQSTAGQGNGIGNFDEGSPMAEDLMMKMEANPVPGQSLTQDPENRASWETPPEIVDVQEFVEEMTADITDPDKKTQLLDVLRHDVSVEYVAQQYLQRKVQEGVINPDTMLLAVEPTIYMMIAMATTAGIDPVLYPEDEMDDGEEISQQTQQLRKATSGLMNKGEPE